MSTPMPQGMPTSASPRAQPALHDPILAIATPTNLEAIPAAIAQSPNDASTGHLSAPVAVATALTHNSNHAQTAQNASLSAEDQNQTDGGQKDVGGGGGEKGWQKGISDWLFNKKGLVVAFVILLVGILAVAIAVPITSNIKNNNSSSNAEQPSVTFELASSDSEFPLQLATTSICPMYSENSIPCQWTQIGSNLLGPAVGDFFGATLRLGHTQRGTRFSVSAPLYDDGKGLTRIFDVVETNSGGSSVTFHQVGQDITPSNHTNSKQQGIMSDDGNTLVLASSDLFYEGDAHGQVEVFFLNTSGQWSSFGNYFLSTQYPDNSFDRVAINRDGTVLMVSDPEADFVHSTGTIVKNAGVVLIHSIDTTSGKWKKMGYPETGKEPHERFGSKISISADGTVIAIGAPDSNNWGTDDEDFGKVARFVYNLSYNKWSGLGQHIKGEEKNDRFGGEVELSSDGKILAVGTGAKWHDDESGQEGMGMVRIYYYDEELRFWFQLGNDISSGTETQLDFGYNMQLSDDGKRVSIGQSKFSPSDELFEAGRVQVFDYIEEQQRWIQVGDAIVGERSCDYVGIGFDLSPDGGRLVVGYPNAAGAGQDGPDCAKNGKNEPVTGIVRLYELKPIE